MKVYLVTTGEYSDYRVNSIWADEETANKVCSYLSSHDHAQVEEFEVNGADRAERMLWKFVFNDAGQIEPGWDSECAKFDGEEILKRWNWIGGGKWLTTITVRGKDKEHAFKKALDVRTQYLANRAGI